MTVPTKTLQHKSNLYLTFSPKCIPWAEVAQFYLSCPNHDNLHLGVDFNLLLKEPTLIVPKGKAFIYAGAYSDSKQTLKGKSSILRYFARLNQSNICLKANSLIEEFLDKIRTAQVSDNKILDLINPKSEFLVGEKISIADLIAWDYTIKSKADSNWFRNISKLSELQKAHDVLSKVLNTIPVLHKYKFIVVEQVAQIFSIDAELVASVMTDSKSKDHGNLVIPIPALKVPGNPVELAKTLVSKVWKYLNFSSRQEKTLLK
jgi:arginyl-tRNA synthetase